ncbi:Tat (twin-arginine translocation) pathway signal sequence [Actinacidiphila yanglinensis]|uniref:Tat (Twin-arginine translocation) pathway signal sequence n=1 Tax=Actinacidiphila yanglinensis TaxID=310779 RepID=A0A1H6C6H0_9ACTN|nr:CBM35 domain-containing protein [Actinacidiphila yanglinensis]SEG68503.1 Tat (twin-arginine translocation) pathway signal sequence [Actinacidiphila yanglinensis]
MTGFSRRDFLRAAGVGSAALAVPWAAGADRAGASTAAPTVLSGTVSASGNWQVTASALGWTFGGSLGSAATGIATRSGSDAVGSYTETTFTFRSGARKGGIRVYDAASSVIFTDTYVEAGAGGDPFPTFTGYPKLPYRLSHSDCFGRFQFNTFAGASDSPWVFFDAKGGTFVLSAANHFQEAQTSQAADGSIAAGVLDSIATLPAGYSRQTILSTHAGVGAAHQAWGSALTRLAGKQPVANDAGPVLATLGYWTDNGADYYYKYDTSKGYTGTLLAVRDEWAAQKIPMGYMQLDSWWYPKGPNADWNDLPDGAYLYEADKELFPDGLAAFQKQLGKPLVTHARWMDRSSPYHGEYAFSDNVVIAPEFWQSVMDYLRDSGVVVYEQDWLCNNAKPAENLTDADAFFDNMAHHAAADGMDMQYCMALPRDYLQTTRYPNLTTIRVSDDRFDRPKWDMFLYDSQLAGSLGVWPWVDVFLSGETRNLLLANLSAGPVGVGDALGKVNAANLFQVARPDGVIVKPDVPIVPTDATYVGEAAGQMPPMVATTRAAHPGLTYAYVFAYARQVAAPQQVLQAESATLSGVVVGTDNAGYTGSGFADYQHASGDFVEWTVQAPAAGTYTLQFRYANADFTPRPLAVTVNGGAAHDVAFPSTGWWTSWSVTGLTVTLAKGANTVRATDTGASGPNIDWLGVTQGAVPTGLRQNVSFTLAEAGVTGRAYAYDYFAGTGTLVGAGGSVRATVTDGTYWVIAPVGASGIAFLGDAGKFVAHGDKRLTHVSDDGKVHATVAFSAGEGPVTLHGYAPRKPTVQATTGSVGAVGYDTSTKLFTVTATAGSGDQAVLTVTP